MGFLRNFENHFSVECFMITFFFKYLKAKGKIYFYFESFELINPYIITVCGIHLN